MEEGDRLSALSRFSILDSEHEPAFDALVGLVSRTLDVPIALVSLVASDRLWFKAAVGVAMSGTRRDIAFCDHVLATTEPSVIPDTLADPRFADNPYVVGEPFVRSYAGAPIIAKNGARIGSVSALDRRPRVFTEAELATLRDAAVVAVELLEKRLTDREQTILTRVAEWRLRVRRPHERAGLHERRDGTDVRVRSELARPPAPRRRRADGSIPVRTRDLARDGPVPAARRGRHRAVLRLTAGTVRARRGWSAELGHRLHRRDHGPAGGRSTGREGAR